MFSSAVYHGQTRLASDSALGGAIIALPFSAVQGTNCALS
jgi:hypothetical protein